MSVGYRAVEFCDIRCVRQAGSCVAGVPRESPHQKWELARFVAIARLVERLWAPFS